MTILSPVRPATAARRLQIFVHDLGATGVVRNALAIANHETAAGHEVRLLTCDASGTLRHELHPSVTVVNLLGGARAGGGRKAQMRHAVRAYRRHSRAWRPDILLSAGNHGHLLSSFAWFGLPGAKVLRISNDLEQRPRLHLGGLWRRAKFSWISRLADQLALVSPALARTPRIAPLVKGGKAVVIPNGVDVAAVRRASAQPCGHPWLSRRGVPVILAVGRHAEQKNFPTLLQAFALARAARPMRLVILGGGGGKAADGLRRIAAQLGVESDVDLVRAQPNPFSYMAAASAVVLPSLWEGSSNVLLEAMACGTPVVASRTAGNAPEILAGGRFGLLVDPLDVEGLKTALLQQSGPDPLLPGSRAGDFDRGVTLASYSALFDRLAGIGGNAALRTAAG